MSRALVLTADIPAPREAVHAAWLDGQKSREFFAPENHIEPRVGGAFEHYFLLDAEPGLRGSEGCTITAIAAPQSLSFTWNFPPHLPIRGEHTHVAVEIEPNATGSQLTLSQTGWQTGPDWDEGYAYFERAWRMVLDNLKAAFEEDRLS